VQRSIEAGDLVVVGVNRFQDEEGGGSPPIMRVDPAAEADQVARLRAYRERRDATAATDALDRLRAAAAGTDNLLPAIIDAVKAGATLGEVSDRLREAWGAYRELVTI
jgi:methylmalonyl-CoA mutase N-terminal domain/subunit